MGAYVLRRLLATIPVMVVVAVFVFFLLRLAPGDPAAIIAGEDATAEVDRGGAREARPRPSGASSSSRSGSMALPRATSASRSSPTCRSRG